jgi:response regulator RpfG family c-di-GMP phosphodiesterase
MNDRIQVLCVDDEVFILRALKRQFMDTGYDIIMAGSGEEGLKILGERPVQVIISDYNMPGMNGIEFMDEVMEKWPETVRIVMSGSADQSIFQRALDCGLIHQFISKPWIEAELKAGILSAINGCSTICESDITSGAGSEQRYGCM